MYFFFINEKNMVFWDFGRTVHNEAGVFAAK